MKVTALFFLAFLAVASAFVAKSPLAVRAMPRAQVQQTSMQMSVEAITPESVEALNNLGMIVASKSGDFGGLAGPIAGLGFIAGLIVLLAPPLDK